MKLGSIELARTICEELKGELPDGEQYGSVDVAEILSAHVRRLQSELAEAVVANATLHDTCRGYEARLRFVATAQNAELLSDCEALFQWLDKRGGLGEKAHGIISGLLKRINAVLAAIKFAE